MKEPQFEVYDKPVTQTARCYKDLRQQQKVLERVTLSSGSNWLEALLTSLLLLLDSKLQNKKCEGDRGVSPPHFCSVPPSLKTQRMRKGAVDALVRVLPGKEKVCHQRHVETMGWP